MLHIKFSRHTKQPYRRVNTLKLKILPLIPICRSMDDVEQPVAIERLLQKLNRAIVQCPGTCLIIVKGRNEDDRASVLQFSEFCLQIQTAHTRKVNIQNQARGICRMLVGKKLLGGFIGSRIITSRFDQAAERFSDGSIVVHD